MSGLAPSPRVASAAPLADVGAVSSPRDPPSYWRRVTYGALGAELLPATARVWLMRRLGFDVSPTVTIWSGCLFRSNAVRIGEWTFLNIGFFFDGSDRLEIGANVRMGQFVKMITGTHNIGPPNQRCEVEAVTAPVRIEDGCWIGANTTILPGVTVRRGCVIGAGSVVTRSTEPDGLYVGAPAQRVKDLPV